MLDGRESAALAGADALVSEDEPESVDEPRFDVELLSVEEPRSDDEPLSDDGTLSVDEPASDDPLLSDWAF